MKRIKFYSDVNDKGLICIKIDEGDLNGQIMMIDTGATNNLLFGNAYEMLKDKLVIMNETSTLYGVDGITTEVPIVGGKIILCGDEYKIYFLLNNCMGGTKLSNDVGYPIAGIIGSFFMAEHNWMIDYAKQEIIIPKGNVCSSIFWKLVAKK